MTRKQQPLRIVVMGTDGRLSEVLVRNLCQWGYGAAVWGGNQQRAASQAGAADFLIIDLDGMEQELLAVGGSLDEPESLARPVARLTIALSSQPLRRKTLEALEAVLFVPKPFDMGVLRGYLMTLERVLAEGVTQPQEPVAPDRQVRVLAADDDSRMTEWACTVLSKSGRYIARAAHDGIEVLEQCLTWEPDCLVMDMMMPKMNGYQVLRCLRARPRLTRLPVVVLSALAEVEVRAEELSQPSLAVLKKPLRSADLLAAVERVLGMRRAEGSRGPLEVG
ncbi:MAG TPA: response regulator [Ktedonobacterales bacterium]|jgi:two-component system alkaline phosphatase synthesis response regulator PhoP